MPRFIWTVLAATLAALAVACGVNLSTQREADAEGTAEQPVGNQKNVLVIMLDDLDVATLARLDQNPTKVPNIRNLLMAQGTTFSESFVSNSVCCPSRATFLTGQYSHNNGTFALYGQRSKKPGGYLSIKPVQDNLLGRWLKDAGYYTGHFGKYMNGYNESEATVVPLGWDEWHSLTDPSTYNLDDYKIREKYTRPATDRDTYCGDPAQGNVPTSVDRTCHYTGGLDPANGRYQTDVLAQRAVRFLTRWKAQAPTKPFFISMMPTAPHIEGGIQPWNSNADLMNTQIRPKGYNAARTPRGHYGALRGRQGSLVDEFAPLENRWYPPSWNTGSFDEADMADKPLYMRSNAAGLPNSLRPPLSNLYAQNDACQWVGGQWVNCQSRLVTEGVRRLQLGRLESMLSIDELVGTLYNALTPADRDDTVIIFTSDNGYMLGEHRLVNKQQPYEESIRVPLIVRPPMTATGAPRNVTSNKMVVNTDLAPTVLEYAGLNPASYQVRQKPIDGRSFKNVVEVSGASWTRKRILLQHYWGGREFWDVPDYQAVRTRLGSGTQGPNTTYAEYYNVPDAASGDEPWDITDLEHYDISTDTAQLTSLHASSARAGERLALSSHLAALTGCSGDSCRRAEDRADPAHTAYLPAVPASSPATGNTFAPGQGYYSGIALQNLGGASADVVVTFQDAFTDLRYSYNYLVPANGVQVVIPTALADFPPGLVGSAVVTSSQPIRAVVNLPNKLSGTVGIAGGTAQAQYNGVDSTQTGSTLRFPLVKNRHYNKQTALYVQNAGSVTTTLTATFKVGSASYVRSYAVEPRKSVALRPQDVPNLPLGLSAATVTASGNVPLAGVSFEFPVVAGTNTPVVPGTLLQASNGFASADYGDQLMLPIVKKLWYGKTTGHQVQNVSAVTRVVRITYDKTSTCNWTGGDYQEATLESGASATFLNFANLPDSCLTSARVETIPASTQSLVGITNESCFGTCNGQTATTYAAIPSHKLTRTLAAPLFKEDHYGRWTGMMVYNSDTAATTATAVFSPSTGGSYSCTFTLEARGRKVLIDMDVIGGCTWGPSGRLPNGTVSAVRVTASSTTAKLSSIVNEEARDGSVDAANYEAFNL